MFESGGDGFEVPLDAGPVATEFEFAIGVADIEAMVDDADAVGRIKKVENDAVLSGGMGEISEENILGGTGVLVGFDDGTFVAAEDEAAIGQVITKGLLHFFQGLAVDCDFGSAGRGLQRGCTAGD